MQKYITSLTDIAFPAKIWVWINSKLWTLNGWAMGISSKQLIKFGTRNIFKTRLIAMCYQQELPHDWSHVAAGCPMFHLCRSVRQNIIRYHLGDHVSYSTHPSAHQVAARLKDMRRRDSVVYWSGFMLWRWRLFFGFLTLKDESRW